MTLRYSLILIYPNSLDLVFLKHLAFVIPNFHFLKKNF